MTTEDFRDRLRERIESLGITIHHAGRLAGLSDQTARDYFAGRCDIATGRAMRIAEAIGLTVAIAPRKGFAVPPAPAPGRKKSNLVQ